MQPAELDPHDPLTPRPDDPRLGRWWAYERERGEASILRWPVLVGVALLLVGLAALAVVLIAGR